MFDSMCTFKLDCSISILCKFLIVIIWFLWQTWVLYSLCDYYCWHFLYLEMHNMNWFLSFHTLNLLIIITCIPLGIVSKLLIEASFSFSQNLHYTNLTQVYSNHEFAVRKGTNVLFWFKQLPYNKLSCNKGILISKGFISFDCVYL